MFSNIQNSVTLGNISSLNHEPNTQTSDQLTQPFPILKTREVPLKSYGFRIGNLSLSHNLQRIMLKWIGLSSISVNETQQYTDLLFKN